MVEFLYMDEQQSVPVSDGPPSSEYKPNVYQLIFWALTYGVIAGLVLLVLRLLANYLSLLWGPVFLAALLWGGYRNYMKQKMEWHQARGQQVPQLSTVDQIKEAARDIMVASQEVARQQQQEDSALAERAKQEEILQQQPVQTIPVADDNDVNVPPPSPPAAPLPPVS